MAKLRVELFGLFLVLKWLVYIHVKVFDLTSCNIFELLILIT